MSRVLTTTLLIALLWLVVCRPAEARAPVSMVAMFPVENLSGGYVPADQITQFFVARLEGDGLRLVAADTLDAFMTRHRVRYAAGIDAATAKNLRQDTGADAVLIVSVELSSEALPPKVALVARLVSIDAGAIVVWADDVGLGGDDAPGLLELGLVMDQATLWTRALDRLAASLSHFVATGDPLSPTKRSARFRSKTAFQKVALEPGKVHRVAVLPFFNLSERRNAGEILALLFMRHLAALPGVRVIDPGDVRQQLLQTRLIMNGGPSPSDAQLVGSLLDVDFVVGGRALAYRDYEGPEGTAHVDFSSVMFDRRTGQVVWSSHNYADGNDGVRFFGRGRSTTAHAMATQMVAFTAESLAEARK